MRSFNNKNGFSLLEIVVVVILLGIMVAFAVPNYAKSVQKSHERDAISQLSSIHSTNKIYHAHADEFLPTGGGDLNELNNGLGIHLLANDKTYAYNRSNVDAYTAEVTWSSVGLRINESPLSGTNPCCSAGTCLLVPDC